MKNLLAPLAAATRSRVRIPRKDGSTLTDIDLLVLDREQTLVLLVQAKWLVRPDYVTEVLSRDEELNASIVTAKHSVLRVHELGNTWIAGAIGIDLPHEQPLDVAGLIINRDFLPSWWVKDEQVPIVDTEFVRDFTRNSKNGGLKGLHESARRLDDLLLSRITIEPIFEHIEVQELSFEIPATHWARGIPAAPQKPETPS